MIGHVFKLNYSETFYGLRLLTSTIERLSRVIWKLSCSAKLRSTDVNEKNQLDAQLIISTFRQLLHVSAASRPIIRRYNRMYIKIAIYNSF